MTSLRDILPARARRPFDEGAQIAAIPQVKLKIVMLCRCCYAKLAMSIYRHLLCKRCRGGAALPAGDLDVSINPVAPT